MGGEGASVPRVLTRKRRMDHRMLGNFIYNYENDKPSRFIPYLKKVRSVLFSDISPIHKGSWERF